VTEGTLGGDPEGGNGGDGGKLRAIGE